MNHRRQQGFSLIELLTVMAVMALVAGAIFQIFYRVEELSARANEELFNLSGLDVLQQRFMRDVREANLVRELPPLRGAQQTLQIGNSIYSLHTPKDGKPNGWSIERSLVGAPDRAGRISLGQKITNARLTTQADAAGRVTLVTLTVKLVPATGSKTSQREFVYAAHPRR